MLHASEVGKHFELILGIAAAENLGAESLTNSRVECSMLSEVVGYVDSENLCPQIAVIACCIATSPYVVKVSGRVSWRYLSIENSSLEESFFLEGSSHVGRRNLFGSQFVPSQVETGGSQVLAQGIGCLEIDALEHAFLQGCWHRSACFCMTGKVVEHLRNGSKRLIKLRRHFYEVSCYGCTGKGVVLAVGEYAVQGVTELMEHGANLVPGDE